MAPLRCASDEEMTRKLGGRFEANDPPAQVVDRALQGSLCFLETPNPLIELGVGKSDHRLRL